VAEVERAYDATLPTPALNRALQAALAAHPPPSLRGRPLRLLYATQIGRRPPVVSIFASAPAAIPPAYVRYLAGRLSEAFALRGVPLALRFRARHAERAASAGPARGRRARGRRSPRPSGAGGRPRRR
jgi:GTP-binding protein